MLFKLNFIVSILFLCLVAFNLSGVWMDNHPSQIEQPDGTLIDVLLSGDEYHNWAHDEFYYTIIQDEVTGFWCWAKSTVSGDVESSGYPIHLHSPQGLNIPAHENISQERYNEKRANKETQNDTRNTRAPTTGEIQNLTIFIRFANQSEFTDPLSLYNDLMNPEEEGVNSMYRYFYDASYQQLEVFSTYYPTPDGNSIISYQDQFPRNYYLPYNSQTNPDGYTNQNEYSRRTTLLRNAILYCADYIPESLNIDGDGDGRVDNIIFIVRGNSGAWADLLWSHMSNLYQANILIHGVRASTYNFNMEDRASISGVGLFAHEFGHSLGLPDFYRYSYNGTPIGGWDLMASDRNPPQSISAWNKYNYLGWTGDLRTITTNGTYTLFPNTVDMFEHSYRINSPNSTNEFFVVEYRSRDTGLTDSNLPASGLLVYRVNPSINGNSQGPPDELYIYRQNGTPTSDGSINTAAYSQEQNRTAINDFTNPYSFLSNGSLGGLNIHSIGSAGETISFYVDITGPDLNYFVESFEDQTFSNLDWVNDSVAPWTIVNDATTPDGYYSAVSGSIGSNESSTLEISMIHEAGYFQFWYRTSTATNGGFLKVYMDGTEILSWSGIKEWNSFAIPVTDGLHKYSYVYQKNNNAGGNDDKVWIDMVGFPAYSGHLLYPATNAQCSSIDRDITITWDAPFQTTVPNPPALLGYKIIQNNLLVNEDPVQGESYTMYNAGGGNLTFWVIAVYEIGEALMSNTTQISVPFATPTLLNGYSEGNGVRLNWEYNFFALNLAGFRVYRDNEGITPVYVPGELRTYHDTGAVPGQTHVYTVRATYINPIGLSPYSNEIEVNFVSEDDQTIPILKTELGYNYPNPFNPETRINFSLKNDEQVRIDIYNIKGERVKTLLNEERIAGNHTIIWNGTDSDGNTTGSGIYFYKMETQDYQSVKKMVMVK